MQKRYFATKDAFPTGLSYRFLQNQGCVRDFKILLKLIKREKLLKGEKLFIRGSKIYFEKVSNLQNFSFIVYLINILSLD
jgi:hypothetical protein